VTRIWQQAIQLQIGTGRYFPSRIAMNWRTGYFEICSSKSYGINFMIQSNSAGLASHLSLIKRLGVFLLLISMLSLSGCGSTKVYNASKTVVYNGSTYNLSNVQRIGSRVEGTLPSGDTVQLERIDKKGFNALLDDNKFIQVTTFMELDDKEFVYRNKQVKSYSDFSKMLKSQESGMNSINKFMANKKSTQLKLK
jgi:hypothetical protein